MKAKEYPYNLTQQDIYTYWFTAYTDHPDREFHWDNIIRCLKDDLSNNVIKPNSKQHKELQSWFIALKKKYEGIKNETKTETQDTTIQ